MITCGGCDSTWSGLGRCHCAAKDCHKTFTGLTHFDRHRRDGKCLVPEDIGMELNSQGYYSFPLTEEQVSRLQALRQTNDENE